MHAFIVIMTDAKVYFTQLKLTLIFGVRASEPPPPPPPSGLGERMKRLGLIGLNFRLNYYQVGLMHKSFAASQLIHWIQRYMDELQSLLHSKGETRSGNTSFV